MKLIGITGNIASGKSTISKMIAEHYNLPLINVDDFSRNWINLYPLKVATALECFGFRDSSMNVLDNLMKVVFTKEANYVDPEFKNSSRSFKQFFEDLVADDFWNYVNHFMIPEFYDAMIIEHPILFEKADQDKFDFIIGVDATDDIRVDRMKKRGYSPATTRQRLNNQIPLYQNKDNIDLILDNNIPLTKEEIINELSNSREFKALISQGSLS